MHAATAICPARSPVRPAGTGVGNPDALVAVSKRNIKEPVGMENASLPINLPDDLRRGLEVASGEAGKTPSEIVVEALESFGIERMTEDQLQKRMTGSQ